MNDVKTKAELFFMVGIALISVAISLIDLLGLTLPFLPAGRSSAATLGVVGILAGYLVLERRNKLDKMEGHILEATKEASKGVEHIIRSVAGVQVQAFSDPKQLYEYIHKRLGQAQRRICDLSWGPTREYPTQGGENAAKEYVDSILRITSEKNISYQEVMTFPDIEKVQRAKSMLDKGASGYQLRYYDVPGNQMPPLMQFGVIDSEEVIVGFYHSGRQVPHREFYFSVKHEQIVTWFQDYYDAIWDGALKVDHDVLRSVEEKLPTS